MYAGRIALVVILSAFVSQTAVATSIQKADFVNPTILDFEGSNGFVGGPNYPDPWLTEGIKIWGACTSGSDIHVYPYANNAVIMEFVNPTCPHDPLPVQRVGADVLFPIVVRLEVYDLQDNLIEYLDAFGPTFMGIDVGTNSIGSAKFIDIYDNWATLPAIDNLYFEVPEPATICLLGLSVLSLINRKR